jgi:hypothetical protein
MWSDQRQEPRTQKDRQAASPETIPVHHTTSVLANSVYCQLMDSVLAFIRQELRYRLELDDSQVKLESATVLGDESDTRGVVISVVNTRVSAYQGGGLGRPELLDSLELVLLFSFRFRDYETSLHNLYKTLRLLFVKPTYTDGEAHPENPFPAHIDKLFFTLLPMEFDALKDVWGMFGGTYFPCALYSLRIVRVKDM